MTDIVISVDRSKLPAHTDEEFEAWVMYNVGEIGGLPLVNHLSDIDMEASVCEIR